MFKKWSDEWGNPCFWNPGSNRSCGVAILFNSESFKNAKLIKQGAGRFQVYEIIDSEFSLPIRLVNVYAPNSGEDRKKFYIDLKILLNSIDEEAFHLIGGDHNCALNSILDRKNCRQMDGDAGNVEINQLISEINLEDIWRRRERA